MNPVAKRQPALNQANPEASQNDIQASLNNRNTRVSFGP
ncbi:hypothetical protein YSA_09902 [Pseudomonas putida ND6]|uniref:Uncharacterized protein n=1 Tax=Pseudomonas putida ND6 TaxID=231023 RepID=I3V326_PSEPU|nr:hypothetical protein YSA_09902 [Pseudomonas putida ND6]